jgi:hypothetical protein
MREQLRLGAIALVAFALVLAGCNDLVRLPDCIDCRPVEMRLDQQFDAELGWGIRPGQQPAEYEWVVADPGTMRVAAGPDVIERSEGPGEFVGDVSYTVTYLLEPLEVGTTTVRFELHDGNGDLATDLVEGQLAVLEITVVVTE